MLTRNDKLAILKLAVSIADAIGEGANNALNRVRQFIKQRGLNGDDIQSALNMDIMQVCDYVSNLTEDKKKIVMWEIFEVLTSEDNNKGAINLFKLIMNAAQLGSAYSWYTNRANIASSCRDSVIISSFSSEEKTAVMVLLKNMMHEDTTRRPNEKNAVNQIIQKYGNFSTQSYFALNLFDAIDLLRIMQESKRIYFSKDLLFLTKAIVEDNIVYKHDDDFKDLLNMVLYETDLTKLFRS